MNAVFRTANWLLPLLYLVVLIDYGATFFLRTRTHKRNPLLIVLLIAHAACLIGWGINIGRLPLNNAYEVLGVVALSMAAVYFVLETAVRDRRAGVFAFLLIFLFQYTSSVFWAAGAGEMTSAFARLHVVPAVIAYTAFAISAIYGTLYILAHRNLKNRRVGMLFDRLPPLELLGRMSWHTLLAGFLFITASLVTGALLANGAEPGHVGQIVDSRMVAKIITGCAAWLIYAVAVLGRAVGGWSGARVSGIGLVGFATVLIQIIAGAVLS